MNSLSKTKIDELALLYSVLATAKEQNEANWSSLSQRDLFDIVTKLCKKKINPSLIQLEIERLEQFQLPRNITTDAYALMDDNEKA